MADMKGNAKQEWTEVRSHLLALRDEIRLKVHLAGMDLKDAWRELDPEVEAALGHAKRGTSASLEQVRHLVDRLRGVRDRMDAEHPSHPHH